MKKLRLLSPLFCALVLPAMAENVTLNVSNLYDAMKADLYSTTANEAGFYSVENSTTKFDLSQTDAKYYPVASFKIQDDAERVYLFSFEPTNKTQNTAQISGDWKLELRSVAMASRQCFHRMKIQAPEEEKIKAVKMTLEIPGSNYVSSEDQIISVEMTDASGNVIPGAVNYDIDNKLISWTSENKEGYTELFFVHKTTRTSMITAFELSLVKEGEPDEPADPEYVDLLSLIAPANNVAAGRITETATDEYIRTGLGEFQLQFSGEGKMSVNEGEAYVKFGDNKLFSWTKESDEYDLQFDTANPIVYLNGVTADMIFEPGTYTLFIPKGFFKQGDNLSNEFTKTFTATPVTAEGLVEITIDNTTEYKPMLKLAAVGDNTLKYLTTGSLVVTKEDGTDVATYTATELEAGVDLSAKISENGDYVFTLAAATVAVNENTQNPFYTYNSEVKKTTEITVNSGVESLVGTEGNTEYFDLQGRRVNNPENGLYIMRGNGKANRVIIRK